MMTRGNSENNNLGDEKRIFCLEKRFIFRKGKTENGQRTKKTKPKGEEKL